MRDGRLSFIVEYIVPRAALEREGGFISFPHAWFADDASWIAFARHGGITHIPGPRVHWRMSDANISGRHHPALARAKTDAIFRYNEWLEQFLGTLPAGQQAMACRIRETRSDWIYHQLGVAGCYQRLALTLSQASRVARATGASRTVTTLTLSYRWFRTRARRLRQCASS